MDENGNEAHERNMEVKFLDELLYYGCPNEAWSVQLLCEEEGSRISLPSPILIRWNYTSLLKRTAIQGLLLLTTGGYETALMSKKLGWQQKNISKAFL